MELELPHRLRMLARIPGFAGFGECQNKDRGIFLACMSLACREGNHQGMVLSERSLPCVQLKGITILKSHSIAKSCLNSPTFSRSSALASPVLGKQNHGDEVKLRLNRRGMALRERSARHQDSAISEHYKSYPNSFRFSRSRAFASPVLGKRKYRDEVKLQLNRQGMALRE